MIPQHLLHFLDLSSLEKNTVRVHLTGHKDTNYELIFLWLEMAPLKWFPMFAHWQVVLSEKAFETLGVGVDWRSGKWVFED